jgi:transcriptional regulator with XRE-family HTH domain
MPKARTYSPYTIEAARLLGSEIAQARRERRWSAQELADRIGVTRPTLTKIERGDPGVGLGLAFEAAALLGVPLFEADPARLSAEATRARERLALLPRRIRRPGAVRDDF